MRQYFFLFADGNYSVSTNTAWYYNCVSKCCNLNNSNNYMMLCELVFKLNSGVFVFFMNAVITPTGISLCIYQTCNFCLNLTNS